MTWACPPQVLALTERVEAAHLAALDADDVEVRARAQPSRVRTTAHGGACFGRAARGEERRREFSAGCGEKNSPRSQRLPALTVHLHD